MKLSDTALIVLSGAAGRDDGMVPRRPKIPPAVDINACRSLEKKKLLKGVRAKVRTDDLLHAQDGEQLVSFRITALGRNAIRSGDEEPGAEPKTDATPPASAPPAPPAAEAAQDTNRPTAGHVAPRTPHMRVRDAAAAVLAAWKAEGTAQDGYPAMNSAIDGLATALAAPVRGAADAPREGTKAAQVLAMLRQPDGVTGAEIQEATSWNSNTTRGFLSGLRKKGMNVTATKVEKTTVYKLAN